ncbi:hypothetical protein J31TS4_26930 [Paenibacillus sp. J31TS4]|uniref:GyrI-like domain-containing protein n=1 Tax=Paenibacillus sp. J31TS4 TaxID=2807195 RepID=UPI001B283E31|nr:GyrI-like domain-containing protein [Paenibacillus sp. J31TS4]GIP39413.1 hypothetical protein J31TS4_26930 [Paenibacillus sp. J31TS4]
MQVVKKDEMRLVGLRVLCPGDEYAAEIPKACAALARRIGEIPGAVAPDTLIGVYQVDACTEEKDGYWVCVQVEGDAEPPAGMTALTVPAQRYAVAYHRGPADEIRATYAALHQEIAAAAFERILQSWHLEIYIPSKQVQPPDYVEIDLYDTIR